MVTAFASVQNRLLPPSVRSIPAYVKPVAGAAGLAARPRTARAWALNGESASAQGRPSSGGSARFPSPATSPGSHTGTGRTAGRACRARQARCRRPIPGQARPAGRKTPRRRPGRAARTGHGYYWPTASARDQRHPPPIGPRPDGPQCRRPRTRSPRLTLTARPDWTGTTTCWRPAPIPERSAIATSGTRHPTEIQRGYC
jgi:hypothetical protein